MLKTRRTVSILLLSVGVLGVIAYLAWTHWPFQDGERPTLVYFYSGV